MALSGDLLLLAGESQEFGDEQKLHPLSTRRLCLISYKARGGSVKKLHRDISFPLHLAWSVLSLSQPLASFAATC